MRIRIVALAAAGAAALFATPVHAQGAAAVKIVDNDFQEKSITVDVGTSVTWTHDGNRPHSVTADDGSFDSSPACPGTCLARGQTFSQTFTQAGTFRYFCKIHGGPNGDGMSGIVVVRDAEEAPPTPQPQPTEAPAPTPDYDYAPPAQQPQQPVQRPAYQPSYQARPAAARPARPLRTVAPAQPPVTPAPAPAQAAAATFEPVTEPPAAQATVQAAAPAAAKGRTSPTKAFVFGSLTGLIAGAFVTGAAKRRTAV